MEWVRGVLSELGDGHATMTWPELPGGDEEFLV